MKKLIITGLFTLLCVGVGAQNLVNYGLVAPTTHEQRGNQFYVKTWVKLDKELSPKYKLLLDGEVISYEKSKEENQIQLWLPLVGNSNVLTIQEGRKTLSSLLVKAPIPLDWGYFANGTIHLIQSSHQDIAWMDIPERCKEDRIQNIIIPALEMMKKNPDYKFEMEQTLNLMEFLEKYPERKEELIQRYKEGRFHWGATFNQPYEGLSSGEQLVRQTYFGRKWIKDNLPGCDDRAANNMDVPGRSLQMPQILAKSGVDKLMISRFGEGLYNWYSPDGSKVCTYSPGNYGWATMVWKFFDFDATFAFNKLYDRLSLWDEHFESRNIPPHYAVLMSCDATKPRDYDKLIAEWNEIADAYPGKLPTLQYSTGEEFMNAVNVEGANFEEIHGERPNLWLYIHGPAHYQQTLAKRQAAVLLPDAEMFSVLAGQYNGLEYPRKSIDRGWLASIYPDHGLGGNHGEITDSIYTDSLVTSKKIGQARLDDALASLTEVIGVKNNSFVVYNDMSWNRSAMVEIPIEKEEISIYNEGVQIPIQRIVRDGKTYGVFYAENVPSVGYKSFKCVPRKKVKQFEIPMTVKQGTNFYENEYYKAELGKGGLVSLIDKATGKDLVQNEKFAFGDVAEFGYTGNGAGEFTRVIDVLPGDLQPLSALPANWKITENGPLFSIYENAQNMANAQIVQKITFFHRVKKIDFDIDINHFNGAHNRQYRILFPLDMKQDQSVVNYEVPMGVLQVGRDEMKTVPGGWAWGGSYVHHPADTHPREVMNFMSINGAGMGFTMSSCVAAVDWIDPSREMADYPIAQAILLSSHHSCHGAGNWYHQTGSHSFHFSILAHEEGWKNGYTYGMEANRPLRVEYKSKSKGILPSTRSFITVSDPFVTIDAFKKCDYDQNVIMRITEMEGEDKTVQITLPFEVSKVVKCSMIEEELGAAEAVKVDGKTLTIQLGHHSIETFKLIR